MSFYGTLCKKLSFYLVHNDRYHILFCERESGSSQILCSYLMTQQSQIQYDTKNLAWTRRSSNQIAIKRSSFWTHLACPPMLLPTLLIQYIVTCLRGGVSNKPPRAPRSDKTRGQGLLNDRVWNHFDLSSIFRLLRGVFYAGSSCSMFWRPGIRGWVKVSKSVKSLLSLPQIPASPSVMCSESILQYGSHNFPIPKPILKCLPTFGYLFLYVLFMWVNHKERHTHKGFK